MPRKGSLNHQIHQRMEALKCFGESRIEANMEYRETIDRSYNNKTVGIHSYNSYAAYKQTCKEFSKWLKENYRVKNIEDITTDNAAHDNVMLSLSSSGHTRCQFR